MSFRPSQHGFPFPNSWPRGTPVIQIPTPLGTIPLGDAGGGLCGGMVFAAADFFLSGRLIPQHQDSSMIKLISRRLLDSWHLPFGVLKYYDWQRRPTASVVWRGVCLLDGTASLTRQHEWPRLQQRLDEGRLVPIGLIKPCSANPWLLGKNHQVLVYHYERHAQEVCLHVYDPNYPLADDARLSFTLHGAEAAFRISHSHEPDLIRGFFVTDYDPVVPEL